MAQIAKHPAQIYDCANCGATTVIQQGEALAQCGFCGTSFVRKAYSNALEALPELIIPFRITKDEAFDRLRAWCNKNGRLKEARLVAQHLRQLQGWYLPYNLVQGPINCEIWRQDTNRQYICSGYIEEMAINTSSQLDNELLDQAEPFDWGEARIFEWGYAAGHRIKVPDTSSIDTLVAQEIEEEFRVSAEHVLHTTGLNFSTNSSNIVQAPALLPMYYLRCNKTVSAVVNGQTGKISVSCSQKRKVLSYLIEPTILTLIVAFCATTYPFYGHWQHFNLELFLGLTAVAATIFYAIFTQDRTAKTRRLFLSEKTAAQKAAKTGDKKRHKPVFFEPVGGEETAVKIRFYTPARVIGYLLGAFVFTTLPALLAALCAAIDGRNVSQLPYGYGAAWFCLSIPAVIVVWARFGRSTIYDYPLFWRLDSDGKAGKRVRSDRAWPKHTQLTDSIEMIKSLAGSKGGIGILLLILFLLLGSTAAILN